MTSARQELLLGPIVGHTDSRSSRVWIRVAGLPSDWLLEVQGQAPVGFVAMDGARNEFGTAIAVVEGLRAETAYAYRVRKSDSSAAAEGSFRTMPAPDSRTEIRFATLSCNDDREPNAWDSLARYVEREQPHFILMIGDQIYVDEGEDDIWIRHLDSPPTIRRQALVEKHQKLWARQPAARIMANTPVYMTWDDHDIRDGWGSFAGDSPTLAAQYPAGEPIFQRYRAFFDDAYNVCYHFQHCHNPVASLPGSRALPFTLRAGGLQVVVPDGRTDRDFARASNAILGDEQWRWVDSVVSGIDANVGAIAVATSVPVVDLDPEGKVHRLFQGRTDDIELFQQGDARALEELRVRRDNPLVALSAVALGETIDRDLRVARALGFRVQDLDDMRDKWSYETNRREQEGLLRTFARAATGAWADRHRALLFLGGDIHSGAIFDLTLAREGLSAQCVVTSGIAKTAPIPEVVGVLVDRSFQVADGIHAELRMAVNAVNFATTRVTFDPQPVFENHIVYERGDDVKEES